MSTLLHPDLPVPVVAERPSDVIDLRRELVDWWGRDAPLQRAVAMQGRRRLAGAFRSPAEEGMLARRWLHGTLRDCELYWVSPEMVDVLRAVAPSMPDVHARSPVPEALVVFAKPIPGIDAINEDVIIHTAALLWGSAYTLGIECLSIETMGWRDLIRLTAKDANVSKEDQRLWDELVGTKLVLTGGSEWPLRSMTSDFSALPAASPTMEASMLEDRRLLAAFWALCEQRITTETREPGDRAVRRRAERAGMKLDPVRVIRLREGAPRTKPDVAGSVEWSHRWLVGQHWRRQYYPSTGQHRAKLIDAYVKGPANKPFIPRETVRALVR